MSLASPPLSQSRRVRAVQSSTNGVQTNEPISDSQIVEGRREGYHVTSFRPGQSRRIRAVYKGNKSDAIQY